jgi:hypothetical protein
MGQYGTPVSAMFLNKMLQSIFTVLSIQFLLCDTRVMFIYQCARADESLPRNNSSVGHLLVQCF